MSATPFAFIQVNRKGLSMEIEFGLDTFGDITVDADGNTLSAAQTIRNIVEQAALADRVGVDFFGVGSTTGATSPCRARRWCWRRSPRARSVSAWAPP